MNLREKSKKKWEKITRKKVHIMYIYVYPSSGDQIEKNGEGGACSTYGGKEGCIQGFGGVI